MSLRGSEVFRSPTCRERRSTAVGFGQIPIVSRGDVRLSRVKPADRFPCATFQFLATRLPLGAKDGINTSANEFRQRTPRSREIRRNALACPSSSRI